MIDPIFQGGLLRGQRGHTVFDRKRKGLQAGQIFLFDRSKDKFGVHSWAAKLPVIPLDGNRAGSKSMRRPFQSQKDFTLSTKRNSEEDNLRSDSARLRDNLRSRMPSLIRFFDFWSCRIAEIDQEEVVCESAVFLFHTLAQSDFCFGLPAGIDH